MYRLAAVFLVYALLFMPMLRLNSDAILSGLVAHEEEKADPYKTWGWMVALPILVQAGLIGTLFTHASKLIG